MLGVKISKYIRKKMKLFERTDKDKSDGFGFHKRDLLNKFC